MNNCLAERDLILHYADSMKSIWSISFNQPICLRIKGDYH